MRKSVSPSSRVWKRFIFIATWLTMLKEVFAPSPLAELRSIARPGKFDGNEASWKDWAFQFIDYAALIDVKLPDAMRIAAGSSGSVAVPIDTSSGCRNQSVRVLLACCLDEWRSSSKCEVS